MSEDRAIWCALCTVWYTNASVIVARVASRAHVSKSIELTNSELDKKMYFASKLPEIPLWESFD